MSRNTPFDAKISRPELPEVFVRRRLLRALEPAPGQRAIFINAPAGYGKTTLLASYLETIEQPSIWYRLDASDADPATFFYFLGLAARRAAPRRRQPMPLLTADHLPSMRAFARTFFEALFFRMGRTGVLVLDDYHLLPPESPLHGLLSESLSLLPKGMQIIVAGRHPPPPAFAGLIANRQLHCLNWEALKLTAWECRGILRLQGVRTSRRGLIKQLMDTTDGWVAGMILLLHGEEWGRLDRVASERLSPGMLFDYFGNEVFQSLNRDTQAFLLKTSLLSQMTAHSAERLTGNVRAARILSKLVINHCFTYRHRGPQEVYRYHALFRTFLLARAHAAFRPDQLRALTLRAAELEQADQHLDAAVELYAQAGTADALVALVCENAAALVAQGRFSTLQGWIERLPPERRERSAWLQYWLAHCLLPFDPAAAQIRFAAAFELFQTQDEPRGLLMAWSGVVDTYIYRWDRFTQLDRWIAWLDDWLSRGSTFPDPVIEGHVACGMANALFYRQPHRGDATAWFDRAWSIARQADDPKLLVQTALSFSHIGWNIGIGAFNRSKILFDALRQATDLEPLSPLLRLQFKLYEAMVECLDRRREERLAPLDEALALAQAAGIHHQDAALYSIEVYRALVMGDAERAAASLERMAVAVQTTPHLFDRGHHVFLRAWEAFLRRDSKRAVEYCQAAFAIAVEAGCEYGYAFGSTALALVLFDDGQVEQAWQAIDRALIEARCLNSPLGEFYARFALAYFKLSKGLDDESLAALRAALCLGREHDFVLSAQWWHHDLLELIYVTALNAGIEPEFVQTSIRRRNFVPHHPPLACKAWPWPLRILTFGGFELIKAGHPLGFGRKIPKKPLELLKALIALGGADVPEGTLIDALWPDSDGDTGHSAFSTTLGRLRHLIGEEFLTVADGRVSLDRRRCWTDVWAFEDLTSRAKAAEPMDDANRLPPLADDALALYRGHFLAADLDAVWALATRERLRARLLALIDCGGRQLGNRGHWREAVTWYHRGLDIDPLAEAFYQGLMQTYQQLGCRAEAVQAYQRCRRTLSLSLGIQPSQATEALYRQVIDAP
jgi:LuxR family transcriptional regulator, maltose regulon positive regulatory protein